MAVLIKFQSIKVTLPSLEEIRLTRFYQNKSNLGTPVLMLHSVAHDGTSFYTDKGDGLACYLAKQGYDVFVGDLRGRGEGWPKVSRSSNFGFHDWITQDIPALVRAIKKRRGDIPQVWMGHGWGGVLLASCYARFSDEFAVEQFVHFSVGRHLADPSLCYRSAWQSLGRSLTTLMGYLPVNKIPGLCNESAVAFSDSLIWAQSAEWCDPNDGFDYSAAAQQQSWPPSFYFATKAMDCFSSPGSARAFMQSLPNHDGRMMLLSKKDGSLHNYGHREMLLHPDGEEDHFPVLLEWLQKSPVENPVQENA